MLKRSLVNNRQRITTKLNHNNCNHCGSLGLETPRVDSPFEAFVSFVAYCLPMTFLTLLVEKHFTKMHRTSTCPTPKAVKLAAKT
ncbi:hypothetical protein CGT81_11480 [Vibrio cholerae]|nr:hypothetical protein CGT81_11480 [Vibrio cholerae]